MKDGDVVYDDTWEEKMMGAGKDEEKKEWEKQEQ